MPMNDKIVMVTGANSGIGKVVEAKSHEGTSLHTRVTIPVR
jgi:NADP-dependent 3-hydroxy acid dehydrogenase YdfG